LAGAAAGVAASVRPIAEQAGVALRIDVPSGMTVRAEPAEVTELLAAVVDNAIKFSSRGGNVTVRARPEGRRAVVEVRDDGCGIAVEDLPFVAEPFFRGRRIQGGYGLGLAIARAIAQRRGGHLSIVSSPGQGTTVSLVLPLQRRFNLPHLLQRIRQGRAAT
jgi:signal transduction histidine kinase